MTYLSEDDFPVIGKPQNICQFLSLLKELEFCYAQYLSMNMTVVKFCHKFNRAVVNFETVMDYEAWDGNLNSACCFTRPKEGTLALIPLLRNYALPDHNYLFCVAPRENIHASFLVKLHFIALRHTTVTAVHKAETVDISMGKDQLEI
ncbi:hypothetical protein T4D_15473 [Trichinella pseudospiralis]|uniref:Uncharacterized protein n=1 Tax=Trichinella pseudospiralis TaxID=6337 RepID=A0A0V1FMJ8_TRIPS|nr:hypothetical protein T4D_15473 [Trichinella pseudospiralis]